jgi:hypothetical protein
VRTQLSATLVLLFPCGSAVAQPNLPKAEAILDKFVAATGGEAAYRRHHSETISGTVEIAGTGITGTVLTCHAEPDYSYSEMNIPMFGKASQGFDGTVAWTLSPTGAKILEGDERAMHRLASRMNSEIHWREAYKRAETVGTEEIDGKLAYAVAETPNDAKPITVYYDVRSGLMVRMILKQQTATSDTRVEVELGDYRWVDGVRVPFEVVNVAGANRFVIRRNEFHFNQEPPTGIFELPAEVKALLPAR